MFKCNMFKIGMVALGVGAFGLEGCLTIGQVTTDVDSVEVIASSLDSGVVTSLNGADVATACSILELVVGAGQEGVAIGLLPASSTILTKALAAGAALETNPACVSGGASDFTTILADIASAIVAIDTATTGTVTATNVVATNTQAASLAHKFALKHSRVMRHALRAGISA